MSKFYPSVVNNKAKKLDFSDMEWSTFPLEAEFVTEEKEFWAGGFQKVFKATSITEGFHKGKWVVKRCLDAAGKLMKETGRTIEEHRRNSV